ncbi:MAG: RebB family R body protein [bacterium]
MQASAEALANAAHNATQAQQSAHQVLLATSTQAAALLLQAGRPAEVSDV